MTEAERSVPRRLAADAREAFDRMNPEGGVVLAEVAAQPAAPNNSAATDTDPIAVGSRAAEGVASYITAAQHIEASVAKIVEMAASISTNGAALAADLRSRGAAIDKMLADFASVAAGTEQRMAEERRRLEQITKNNGSS